MKLRIIVATLLLALQAPMISAAFPFRTIALTGQHAPGMPDGVVFSRNINRGVINEDGTVAFGASVAGPGIVPSNTYGFWKDGAGVLTNIAQSGEQAVGLPAGVNYGLLGHPSIDAHGRTAFVAAAPGESMYAVFSEGQGSLRLVARETDQVPGLPAGVNFDMVGPPLMNAAGQVAFASLIQEPGEPNSIVALFSDRAGPLKLVLKHGDAAPGIPGANIFELGLPALNDLGVIAFRGRYTGGGLLDNAIWTEQSGAFSQVVRSGQAAPGMTAGVVFRDFGEPRINNGGQVLFGSSLTGPGIDFTNSGALWISDGGAPQLVAREGAVAAGMSPNIKHGDFYSHNLNGAGEATFVGELIGPDVTDKNDTALWSQQGDALVLIAREGDPAPGMATGIVFGDFEAGPFGSVGLQVNKLGQVAFKVRLTGPGVTISNKSSIWVTDHTGMLRNIARQGDLFDVNTDPAIEELRRIGSIDFEEYNGGGEDGYGSSFNSKGELVIALGFRDLSGGVFVINTAVPEPSTAYLFTTAALVMQLWRSTRDSHVAMAA